MVVTNMFVGPTDQMEAILTILSKMAECHMWTGDYDDKC